MPRYFELVTSVREALRAGGAGDPLEGGPDAVASVDRTAAEGGIG